MAGITLPPLEYCTLKRAAEILECAISDLLNWAVTGRIEVCVYLDYADADIWLTGNQDNNPEVYDYLKNAYGYIGPNSHIDVQESRDTGYYHSLARKERRLKTPKALLTPANRRYIKAYLSGLWSIYIIPPALEIKGYIDIPAYDPDNIQTPLVRPADVAHFFITPFQLRNDSTVKFTIDDLYITRTQIENLLRASSLTDDYSSEKEIPVFHLENNKYSFLSTHNNYSMSNRTVNISNIHNETHHHNTQTPKPVQPKKNNPKRTESNATEREQFLQAAIHIAFNSVYEEKFKTCISNGIINPAKWASLIIENAETLLLTKTIKVQQSEASVKNMLNDCLKDIHSRTQHQNKSFRLRQQSDDPLL